MVDLTVWNTFAVIFAIYFGRQLLKLIVVRLWPPFVRQFTAIRSPWLARLAIRMALARDRATGLPYADIYGKPENFRCLQEVFERFPIDISVARPLPNTCNTGRGFSVPESPWVYPADGRAAVVHVDVPMVERGTKRVLLPKELVGQRALWVYLAPRDLHWCFAPCDLTIVALDTDEHISQHRVTKAHSLPLNRWSCLTFRPGLPTAEVRRSPRRGGSNNGDETPLMRIIMVGAFGVDDFHWKLDSTVKNSEGGKVLLEAGMGIKKGAPLGHFRAGSSVLVLPWSGDFGNIDDAGSACLARTEIAARAT